MSGTHNQPFLVSGQSVHDVGQIRGVLAAHGRELVFARRRHSPHIVFSPDTYAGLIVLGDSTNNRATYRHFAQERDWLAASLEAGCPVLGICLGAQMLAAHQNRGRKAGGLRGLVPCHVGVCDIDILDDGRSDPVLMAVLASPRVAMSHEDAFLAPAGAVSLAWSTGDECEKHCEAFRVGQPEKAVYGLQFHPEPTADMLANDAGWFDQIPPMEELQSAAATGLLVLSAWAALALAR